MWDERSFDTRSFDTRSWLFGLVFTARSLVLRLNSSIFKVISKISRL